MPNLNEVVNKLSKKSKFVKKEYRPWDLGGNSFDQTKDAFTASLSENTNSTIIDNINTKCDEQKIQSQDINNQNIILEPKKSSIESIKSLKEVHKSSFRVQNSENTVQQELNKGLIKAQSSLNQEQFLHQEDNISIRKAISRLAGNDQKLFFFVIKYCASNGSLSTEWVISSEFDSNLEMPRNSRETSIKRLTKKGLLIRNKGKRGRNGVITLEVTEAVKSEALSYITSHRLVGEYKVQQEFNKGFYNSNSYINTTTETKNELPPAWSSIDYSDLEQIGFSSTQIKQLYDQNLNTPEGIQLSINHFSFGLENNPDVKKYPDPRKILMGVLRKGGLWTEKDYISPQEKAQRNFIEHKKQESVRLKKLEEDAFKTECELWKSSLSESEIEKILVEKSKPGKDITPKDVKLSSYFREKVWPIKKEEYFIKNDF